MTVMHLRKFLRSKMDIPNTFQVPTSCIYVDVYMFPVLILDLKKQCKETLHLVAKFKLSLKIAGEDAFENILDYV